MSQEEPVQSATGVLGIFDRHGLPGLVIGALFLSNAALLYVLFTMSIPALKDSTAAMTRGAIAMENLTTTIKETRQWIPPRPGSTSGITYSIPLQNTSSPFSGDYSRAGSLRPLEP